MKKLSSFYFVGLAVLNLVMGCINGNFSFFDTIFIILALLPLLINRKWVHQVFGGGIFLISSFVFAAVFIFQVKQNYEHLNPLWTYGTGYVFSLIMLFFGLLMTDIINISYKKASCIIEN